MEGVDHMNPKERFSGPNLQVRMEQDFVHQPQLVAEDY